MKLYQILPLVLLFISKKNLGCHEQLRFIELDHQHVVFSNQQKIVALKSSSIQACSSFTLNLIQECNAEVVHQWTINGSMLYAVVSVDSLIYANSLLLFHLSTTTISNDCPIFQLYFQILSEVTTDQLMITLHGFTCINFSTQAHSGALYIVIPTKNSCKPDCICPIILIADQDCLNFQVCSCIMDTLFNNSLSLCAVTPTHFQLCISNVTNGMNNTNVHLYTRTYSNCAQPYRKYIKAFKIFIGMANPASTLDFSLVESHTDVITTFTSAANVTRSLNLLQSSIHGLSSNTSFTMVYSDQTSPSIHVANNLMYLVGIVISTVITCITIILIITGVIITLQKRKKQDLTHIYDDIGRIHEHSDNHSQLHNEDGSIKMTPNPIYNF